MIEDVSRNSWSGKERRMLQLSIWYPAKQKTETMIIRDYIALVNKVDDDITIPNDSVKKSRIEQFKQERSRADSSKVLALLSLPTRACYNAQAASGRHPVILALSSGGAPHSWHIMAEFLASYGFVVVSLPMPSDFTTLTSPAIDNACVLDLQVAINNLSEVSFADISSIGIIGYSAGAVRGSLLQMQSSRIKAFISLEGSDGSSLYWANFRSHPAFDITKVTVPYTAVYGTPGTRSWFNGFHFYDELPLDSYRLVEVPGLQHNAIGSWSVYNRFAPLNTTNTSNDKEAVEINTFLHTYTLHFMQAHLQNNYLSRQFINQSALQNNLPEKRYILRRYTEKSLLTYSHSLQAFGKIDEATAALRQCIELYPHSREPKILLAEILISRQQKSEASLLIESILQQDPSNNRALLLKTKI